jgi:hypothetical protein
MDVQQRFPWIAAWSRECGPSIRATRVGVLLATQRSKLYALYRTGGA